MHVKIGTRRSALAKKQADAAIVALRELHPLVEVELFFISTHSEEVVGLPDGGCGNAPLDELQLALADGAIDIAIHSVTDLAALDTELTTVGGMLLRADPREALLTADQRQLQQLDSRLRIGVLSPRQRVQLASMRPDLQYPFVHGDLTTRTRMMKGGNVDGILTALADLVRMDLMDTVSQVFSITEIVPAPGQGAVALEVRSDDAVAYTLAMSLNHEPTRLAVLAERSYADAVDPSGEMAVGAYASVQGDQLRLIGMVAPAEGGWIRRDGIVGLAPDAVAIGGRLAVQLTAA